MKTLHTRSLYKPSESFSTGPQKSSSLLYNEIGVISFNILHWLLGTSTVCFLWKSRAAPSPFIRLRNHSRGLQFLCNCLNSTAGEYISSSELCFSWCLVDDSFLFIYWAMENLFLIFLPTDIRMEKMGKSCHGIGTSGVIRFCSFSFFDM